jgi:RHS repeat-associated protein
MLINERTYSATAYRFGFNGKENDDEVSGAGNCIAFEARIYDSRLSRWFSVDPFWPEYPYISSYSFALNSPIYFIDPDGNRIVGNDRHTVTLSIAKGEDGKFSLVVTSGNLDPKSDAYKMLSSMVLSEQGRAALITMQSSDIKYKTNRMAIVTNEPATEHGATEAFSVFKDNRPKKPYITAYTGYSGMYADRMEALKGLDESLYINTVMVHEILGHNENASFTTRDRNGWKTEYGKDLSKRIGKAMKTKTYEGSEVQKEEAEYVIGYMEYEQIKLDLSNTKEILGTLYSTGKIDKTDYDKRMGIVSSKLEELEKIKSKVDSKIEASGKKGY